MRRHLSYANIVSTLALVLVLSGTAYAAATITGKDIKNSSVTGKDIKDSSLAGPDVKDDALTGSDLQNGSVAGADLVDGSVTGLDVAGLTIDDLASATFPGARMDKDGGVVPQNAVNALDMDTEGFDTGGMYTAPGDVIIVQRTGTYLIQGTLHWGGGETVARQIRIMVNATIKERTTQTAGAATHTMQVQTVLPLVAGDTVALGTFQQSGVDVLLANFAFQPDANLIVQMISP